jgi:hypothetical protein
MAVDQEKEEEFDGDYLRWLDIQDPYANYVVEKV